MMDFFFNVQVFLMCQKAGKFTPMAISDAGGSEWHSVDTNTNLVYTFETY